jgi:tetratricopeptide (TPR) repeat protein
MDLQEFNSEMLYFQTTELSFEVEQLVAAAAQNYGAESEQLLLQALHMAPQSLTVLIGLYRYYYYQHRYRNAIEVARQVMAMVGQKIEFPDDWRKINMNHVACGVTHTFTLVRLYFFALKAAGYCCLRMAQFEEGRAMLEKVVAMDSADRIGARLLLEVLDGHKADVIPFIPPSYRRAAHDQI